MKERKKVLSPEKLILFGNHMHNFDKLWYSFKNAKVQFFFILNSRPTNRKRNIRIKCPKFALTILISQISLNCHSSNTCHIRKPPSGSNDCWPNHNPTELGSKLQIFCRVTCASQHVLHSEAGLGAFAPIWMGPSPPPLVCSLKPFLGTITYSFDSTIGLEKAYNAN